MNADCPKNRDSFSAYIDGMLPPDETAAVERHLRECSECSYAFAELKKTVALISEVPQEAPPPWLKTKIMAQVRAQNPSIWRRLFEPWHIKIPLEALGLIIVAITAIYIFKLSDSMLGVDMEKALRSPAETTATGEMQRARTDISTDISKDASTDASKPDESQEEASKKEASKQNKNAALQPETPPPAPAAARSMEMPDSEPSPPLSGSDKAAKGVIKKGLDEGAGVVEDGYMNYRGGSTGTAYRALPKKRASRLNEDDMRLQSPSLRAPADSPAAHAAPLKSKAAKQPLDSMDFKDNAAVGGAEGGYEKKSLKAAQKARVKQKAVSPPALDGASRMKAKASGAKSSAAFSDQSRLSRTETEAPKTMMKSTMKKTAAVKKIAPLKDRDALKEESQSSLESRFQADSRPLPESRLSIASQPHITIVLKVPDVPKAVEQTVKAITKLKGKVLTSDESLKDKAIIIARLSTKRFYDLLDEIKEIGLLQKLKDKPGKGAEITVRVEIYLR